jgi:lantibiotic modifying enzyme
MNASGAEHARDLTGFAHGAGGIGWALLELGTTLGVEEFVSGAREAMRYENRWYAPDDENWPDFRESDGTEFPAPSMMAWCHGAPGILLSRARASQLLGDPQHRLDLERGMRTAVRWLSDPDVAVESSYTLCHGQLGVAECILHAAAMLGDDNARSVALGAAGRGMMAHSGDPGSWLPGVRRGRNLSLMLGLAGIGHFHLRLALPDVPSVLLWGRAGQAPNERSASRASRT